MIVEPNDPALKSFIPTAADSHFPIQNLPFGVFSTPRDMSARVGVAIGEWILDLAVLERAGVVAIDGGSPGIFERDTIHAYLECGPQAWRTTRWRISELLRIDNPELRDNRALRAEAFVAMDDAVMQMPLRPTGFTDFYSSKEHATNVGAMFRDPHEALLPNWLELPVAYNGRASSIVVSGTHVRRPLGQIKEPGSERPTFGPTQKLDFELETAFIVGRGNALGEPVSVADAERHIFGMVLLNDWSARDIQQWEYAPLGPFNGKSFATSISSWVVTMEALEPFRVAGPAQSPEPLPYLRQSGAHAYDIELEVDLHARGSVTGTRLCRGNFKTLYWSMAQQLAHHTVSGCNLQIGDVIGSGTISGRERHSLGSLLELTRNGTNPVRLSDTGTRTFLEDFDELRITGYCETTPYKIGFGDLRGTIAPAPST